MKVSIKKLSVSMEIKNTGVEIDVYTADGSNHLGDLVITRSGMTWCKGRTTRQNGVKITWQRFIDYMESL